MEQSVVVMLLTETSLATRLSQETVITPQSIFLCDTDPRFLDYLFWHDFNRMGIGSRIVTLAWWCFHRESDVEMDILDHTTLVSSYSRLPFLINGQQRSGFSHNTTNFSPTSS
jgi:hypothetical protein